MKKKRKKHRLRTAIIVFFLIFLFSIGLGLVYLKVHGFNQALTDLVNSTSNGKLALEIGETDINSFDLDFRLADVVIRKASPDAETDLESMQIPFIQVNLGSFWGVFTGGQFKLEQFTIAEPLAELSPKKQEEAGKNVQPVNIAHEIAIFYPAVKAILDRFNIQDFRIQRAGLTLHKPESDINIRFIDLLVQPNCFGNLLTNSKYRIE